MICAAPSPRLPRDNSELGDEKRMKGGRMHEKKIDIFRCRSWDGGQRAPLSRRMTMARGMEMGRICFVASGLHVCFSTSDTWRRALDRNKGLDKSARYYYNGSMGLCYQRHWRFGEHDSDGRCCSRW